MNVLLVNPQVPDTFWSLKNALKFVSKKAILPPMGLLTIASLLPKEWPVRLVDTAVRPLRDRDIQWADIVLLTAMFIQKKSADQIIARCQQQGKKVAVGGPLFTSIPELYTHVDHLILKEGEITLPMFLNDLQNGSPRKVYTTHDKADLQTTPLPRWDLVKMKHYGAMGIQYSRGCPFDCDFCDVTTLFGRRIRTKSIEQVLAELDHIYATGWRHEVFFVDDNLIGNTARIKTHLLPAVIKWMEEKQYPFTFNTQASINLADDEELMELMVKAGFDCVFVGIETPNQESLSECNKVQNRGRDLLACVQKIQRFGLQVQGGFILGFDHDDASIFDSVIQFIQHSGIVMAMVGLLNAPRGTKLFQRLMKEQRLLNVSTGDNTDCTINFIPQMGKENLIRGYKKVLDTIYSQRHYCRRIRSFLKNYRLPSSKKFRPNLREIGAFLKSIWHIGILSRGQIHYWKLIFWSLQNPQYFRMTVRFSIYGYHFRKIFKNLQRQINRAAGNSDASFSTVPAAVLSAEK